MYIHSAIKDKSMICFVYTPSSQQFIVNVPDDKELYNDFTDPATDTCSPSSLKPLYWSFIHVVVSRKSSTVYGSHQSFNFPLLSYWRPTITHLNQNPGGALQKNLKLFDGRIFFQIVKIFGQVCLLSKTTIHVCIIYTSSYRIKNNLQNT